MILGRVILAPPERRELKRRARSRSLAVESVRRAKVILMLAAGDSYSQICERLHESGDAPLALAQVQRKWLVKLRQEQSVARAATLAGPFVMRSKVR